MGNNLRRVYIYPPLDDDDGVAANFWPPGTADRSRISDDQLPSTSSDSPESYLDQGGGLLGMLLRGMQQGQPSADPSLASNGAPDVDSGNYGTPQGGLLGRFATLQARQNQLFAGSNGLLPSESANPDIRKLTRVFTTTPRQVANDPSDRSDDQSNSSYSSSADRNSSALPVGARQGEQAAQPDQSFSDQLQAYWDHPHPYGMVAAVKRILNGMALAVQSSIDATRVPLTEEDVFRQDWSREHGPIAAWEALSGLRSMTPRGVGGILGRPLITSREPSPQAAIGDKTATPRSVVTLNPAPAAPQTSGGLFSPYSGKRPLPWIPDAPRIQPRIDETQAKSSAGDGGGRGSSGNPETGGDGDDGCEEARREAFQKCGEASMNNWKGRGAEGPYSKPRGKRKWTVEDCVNGVLPERCGGLSTDYRKKK
jgi:hypothetical protein